MSVPLYIKSQNTLSYDGMNANRDDAREGIHPLTERYDENAMAGSLTPDKHGHYREIQ